MKNKEYFKDFDDFDYGSQEILKQIYNSNQILSFEDISDGIGKTIQKTTPNETATQDNYTEDFYGLKSDEGIKMPDLIEFLRKADPSVKFDWTQFKAQQSSMTFPNPYGFSTEVKLNGNIPFGYTNENGKKINTNITGIMNKRIDYIESVPYFSLNVDVKNRYLNCSIVYFCQNTAQYRQQIPLTASKTDFTVNNKYKAVQFSSNNLDDLAHLAKDLENDNTWLKKLVNSHFLPLLRKQTVAEDLIFLYRSSPDWVLQNLTAEELWAHLNIFFNYDENSSFKDASDVFIKTLLAYNSVEKLTFLFDKLSADQAFIKRIYSALDGNAVVQGQEQPAKTIFASFLVSLCYMNMAKCKVRNKVFKIGKNYKIDGNIILSNDKFNDRYFLQQQQIQQQNLKVIAKEGNPNATEDVEVNLDAGDNYYPLDLVTLEDVSEPAEKDAKDAKTKKAEPKKMLVPAVFVKDIAHLTEYKEITDNVRLGVDLVVLALSIASLGSSSPLVVLVSALDATIAGGDILVLMNEDKLSKDFLDNWNLVVMAGGAATAAATAPALVTGMLRAGALVLTSAGRAEVMTFVKTCLLKAFLELKISNFEANTLKVLTPQEIFLGAEYKAIGEKLGRNGVIFLGGVKEGKYAESFAAVYKGEVIEEFSRVEISKFYKTWCRLTDKEIQEALEQADFLAKWDVPMTGPGGKGFLGGQKLGRQEIKIWVDLINKISKGKSVLRILDETNAILKGGQAGFNPFTMEIFVKKGVTEYEIFHEFKHLEEFIKIGKEEYVKGWKFVGGTPEQHLIRQYQREMYVYNKVMKEAKKFNKEQLKHAYKQNIEPVLERLENAGIDINKIKITR